MPRSRARPPAAARRVSPGRRRPIADDPVARLYDEIYAVVRRIPRGRVLTYGQVAELAGHPGAARAAGAAMRASTGRGLPWQRVVGAHARGLARIAILDPIGGAVQRGLLEKEGVDFTPGGYIQLGRHGGMSAPEPRPRARGARRPSAPAPAASKSGRPRPRSRG